VTKKIQAFLSAQEAGIKIYGDLTCRNKTCPKEPNEQLTFFNNLPADIKKIAVHVKNEGKKTYGQAAHDKAQGQVKGASDIIIPGKPTFVCELKRKDANESVLHPDQVEYLLNCKKQGAFVCIALGYEEALKAVDEWMRI